MRSIFALGAQILSASITNPVSFHKEASCCLMVGGPAVITEHEARDVNRLKVR